MNLYYYISWLAAIATLPLAIVFEFRSLTTMNWSDPSLLWSFVANGAFHYAYNQMSFLILGRLPALSHSIGNAARRFVIITLAIFILGTPLTFLNKVGIGKPRPILVTNEKQARGNAAVNVGRRAGITFLPLLTRTYPNLPHSAALLRGGRVCLREDHGGYRYYTRQEAHVDPRSWFGTRLASWCHWDGGFYGMFSSSCLVSSS